MESLKQKTAKGIAWGAVNNGTTQVLNLVFGIVLARRLSTADYGIVGLIAVFTLLAGCLQSAGFSQALANMKQPRQQDYSAVFWFNVLMGLSMYVLLFFCAPLIARFFSQPVITDVSRLAFLSIPISAAGIVPNAKLWIELHNRELAIANVTALLLSGFTGMWLAWHDYAYWSLAWQQVVFIAVSSLLKYIFTGWHPSFPIDLRPIRPMLSFSSKLLFTSLLTVASQNVLTFIFGKLLPIQSVGHYSQASKWNTMGSSFISGTMQQVAQPVLTRTAGDEERQERVFRKMLRFTSFVSFPLMFGLALVARPFILLTIGSKWEPAVPLLQLLCLWGAFIPLHTLYQNFIISRKRSDIYMWCMALQMVVQIVVTLVLARKGIEVMTGAYAVTGILFTLCWHVALQRTFRLSLSAVLTDMMPPVLVAAVAMLAAYAATLWVHQLPWQLLLRMVVAAVVYLGAMRLLGAEMLSECLAFVKESLFHKKG